MEEATAIATEYISTLDNLPQEVSHLLAEIRIKDNKLQEVQNDIQSRSQKYFRQFTKPLPSPVKDPPADIDEQLTQIKALSAQKVALAERIVDLIRRACGRLDVDIARAIAVSGEPPIDLNAVGGASQYAQQSSVSSSQVRVTTERLREALKSDTPTPDASLSLPQLPNVLSMKKRRLAAPTTGSTPSNTAPGTPARSGRAATTIRSNRRSESAAPMDEDEDMEEDGGKEMGDPEDQELYCYCRKLSYGEMVGCDNSECPYQWFHLSCTGIKGPLPESWYCADCAPKFQAGGTHEKIRKGRRPRS